MVAITTRETAGGGATVKGAPLSNAELDANFINLNEAWRSGAFKEQVLAATTANITLSGAQTLDTVNVTAGMRVLVKNQTTASQNGIYVAAAGAWTRATDADSMLKLAGAVVSVAYGSALGGKLYRIRNRASDALGTTNVTVDEVHTSQATYQGASAALTSLSNTGSGSLGLVRKTNTNTYGIDTTDYAVRNAANTFGALTVANVAINSGLLYADGNHTVLKTGGAGAERYWRFEANGTLYVLNGWLYTNFNVQAMGQVIVGDAFDANRSNLEKGFLKLRSNGYGPYVDFSKDASTDFHARISYVVSDDGFYFSHGNGAGLTLQSGGAAVLNAAGASLVYANGGSGTQSGPVLTATGGEQVIGKQLTFTSTMNPQDGAAGAWLEIRGQAGGYGAWMKFHQPGTYGMYFGAFNGAMYHGGWSSGASLTQMWDAKNLPVSSAPDASKVSMRDPNGRLRATRFIAHPGVDGVGYRYWQNDDNYGNWMSNANNATLGGRVPGETTSDYNTYFAMRGGTNRGWNFIGDSGIVAGIDGTGNARMAHIESRSEIYTQNWVRGRTSAGYYWETHGRGFCAPEQNNHSYGHIAPYGVGRNSWHGYNLGAADNICLMSNNSSEFGFHRSGVGWLLNMNFNGDANFRGNVTAYSDLRLKTLVGDGKIDNVRARRDNLADSAIMYTRDDVENSRVRIGYGAQTLRNGANPELVHEANDIRKIADGLGTLSVDYGESAAILAVASKETDERVDRLEAEIAELKKLIERLTA